MGLGHQLEVIMSRLRSEAGTDVGFLRFGEFRNSFSVELARKASHLVQ